jgi:NADH-quinone oxidoreductase subunit E
MALRIDTDKVPRFGAGSRVPGWDDAVDLEKDPAAIPDPALTPVPGDLRAEIEAHMAKYPDTRSASIPALMAAKRKYGWITPEAFEQVACVMRLTPAYLAAVATFYDMLDSEPVGRKVVYVCTNISCSLCGAWDLLEQLQGELGDDDDVHLRGFECLGACDIAPMASVNGVYVGPVTADEVPVLAQQIRDGADPLPGKQLVRRAVADTEANTKDWGTPLPPPGVGPEADQGRPEADLPSQDAGQDAPRR